METPGTQPYHHSTIVDEINRVHELTRQLRAIVLPLSDTSCSSELVRNLFEDIFGSLNIILSKPPTSSHVHAVDPDELNGLRKRRKQDPWTIVTTVPHEDGHQWRKYGQKKISSSKFPRSYYRCTYHNDQGCSATKTVQQKDGDGDGNGGDYPPKFKVTYNSQHTCKNIVGTSLPCDMESSGKESTSHSENKELEDHSRTVFTEVDLEELLSYEPNIDMPPTMDVVPNILPPWDDSMDISNNIDKIIGSHIQWGEF